MGQRMPAGAPTEVPQQGGGDIGTLVEGVNEGLVTLAALVNQQDPQAGQRFGALVAEFQGMIKELGGGGGAVPQQGGDTGAVEAGAQGAPAGPQGRV